MAVVVRAGRAGRAVAVAAGSAVASEAVAARVVREEDAEAGAEMAAAGVKAEATIFSCRSHACGPGCTGSDHLPQSTACIQRRSW